MARRIQLTVQAEISEASFGFDITADEIAELLTAHLRAKGGVDAVDLGEVSEVRTYSPNAR